MLRLGERRRPRSTPVTARSATARPTRHPVPPTRRPAPPPPGPPTPRGWETSPGRRGPRQRPGRRHARPRGHSERRPSADDRRRVSHSEVRRPWRGAAARGGTATPSPWAPPARRSAPPPGDLRPPRASRSATTPSRSERKGRASSAANRATSADASPRVVSRTARSSRSGVGRWQGVLRQQLLDVQRDALAEPGDLGERVVVGLHRDGARLLLDLLAHKGSKADRVGVRQAAELEHRVDHTVRRADVPGRQDQEQATPHRGPGQEAQQVHRRLVRPVRVLDDERRRSCPAKGRRARPGRPRTDRTCRPTHPRPDRAAGPAAPALVHVLPVESRTLSGPTSRTSERSTSAAAPYGMASPESGTAWPKATTVSSGSWATNSRTRRVLPMPASPVTSATWASPASARA